MPQMGESIFEGTITKWLKQPGEKVQRDEPLFEISTDKVDAEIPAPASGTLQDIKVQAGATVQVNTVVGTIAGEGEAAGAAPSAPAASTAPRPLPEETAAARPRRKQRSLPVARSPSSLPRPRPRRAVPPSFPRTRRKGWSASSRARCWSIPKRASRSACAPARWCAASPRKTMLTWPRFREPALAAASPRMTSSRSSPSMALAAPSPRLRRNRPRCFRASRACRSSHACGHHASAAGRRRHARRGRAHVGHAQEDCRAHGACRSAPARTCTASSKWT